MKQFILFCKSYRGDLERLKVLVESVIKYNEDNILFYVSVPLPDLELIKKELPSHKYLIVVSDESIAGPSPNYIQGWRYQQIVKMSLFKAHICDYYLCLDSDSYFIKPFKRRDFMDLKLQIPYTICHEHKDFFELTQKMGLPFDPKQSFEEDRRKVMHLFEREDDLILDFGPSPVIWSCEVFKWMNDSYGALSRSFYDLIDFCSSEFTWYGECLLANKFFPILPKQPLFKVFHYQKQYEDYKNLKYTEQDIAKNYLGIIMQSNWNAPLKY